MENETDKLYELLYKYVPHNVLVSNGLPTKKPLFTTEDGVEKFKGDKYYYINKHGDVKETNNYDPQPGFVTKRYDSLSKAEIAATKIHCNNGFSLNDINDIIKGMPGSPEIAAKIRQIAYEKHK